MTAKVIREEVHFMAKCIQFQDSIIVEANGGYFLVSRL
jgi:hypothetical protein